MLLTLTTTHRPATDLGFLLRKNPARTQVFDLSFGKAHVFYPEATEERCTAALFVEVDPIGLVRNRRGPSGEGGLLDRYVNDRPYAASSFLSVAIARVLDSALGGRSKERPDLAEQPIPLRAVISALPCRGGEVFLQKLFIPLGYHLTAARLPLDERFPEWGASVYFKVELEGTLPLHQLLGHLYVLMPVLDDEKHYWVGDEEVEKLVQHGKGWLAAHPEREAITRRYLKHRRDLVDDALSRLTRETEPGRCEREHAQEEEAAEQKLSLHEQRLNTVIEELTKTGAASVIDLGCGEGRLLRLLMTERQFEKITGMDVSHRALQMAAERLKLDRLAPIQKERLTLLHGSLMYRDERLSGHEAAAVVEVIEHLDPPRLAAFERVLFECARPKHIVLTTPNREFNDLWPNLLAGRFRHRDHRFEWTRSEFAGWCESIRERFQYEYRIEPVGPVDPDRGAPTQMGVFTLR